MASRGKKKTTMAKLNRETKLRERRQIKEARKEARERARHEPPVDEFATEAGDEAHEEENQAENAPSADIVSAEA
ncbi:MAG TPA: hypothetical protein VKS25_00090 [Solirubrobacteraceae bacterium]|nr:hypothetical protein [Solirubrobacteraceae bacterium]